MRDWSKSGDDPCATFRIRGHFAIRPAGDFQASRAYVDHTMALEATFRTDAGTAVLIRRLRCTQEKLDVDVT